MINKNDAQRDNLITKILDELLLRERQGEKPVIEEYLEKYPQYRTEIKQAFDEEQRTKHFLKSIRNPEKSSVSDVTLDAIWQDIVQEIEQSVFQDEWTLHSLTNWLECARRKDPTAIKVLNGLRKWIQHIAHFYFPLKGIYTQSMPTTARVWFARVKTTVPEDISEIEIKVTGKVKINDKSLQTKEIEFSIDHFQIDDQGTLDLQLNPSRDLAGAIAEYPVNIVLEAEKKRIEMGDFPMKQGKIKINLQI